MVSWTLGCERSCIHRTPGRKWNMPACVLYFFRTAQVREVGTTRWNCSDFLFSLQTWRVLGVQQSLSKTSEYWTGSTGASPPQFRLILWVWRSDSLCFSQDEKDAPCLAIRHTFQAAVALQSENLKPQPQRCRCAETSSDQSVNSQTGVCKASSTVQYVKTPSSAPLLW